MKNKKSRLGLAILAGGLSFVGNARALDLVIDGSYESSTNNLNGFIGTGGDSGAGIDGGWTSFTTYAYSANYTQAGPAGSGQVYLRPYSPNQTVSQVSSLTRAITTAQIDGSQGQYVASAWFSTYLGQNDYSDLTLQFLDASQSPIGDPVALGGLAFVSALPGGSGARAWGQDSKLGLVPPGARYASITTVSTAQSGQPDGYIDLVSLDVTAGFLPIQVSSASPVNNATGVSPNAALNVSIQDGTPALNPSSVLMWFDGSPVTPVVQKPGAITSVEFDPPGLLASQTIHTYAIAFNNTGGATANATNQCTFTVAPWANINLGAPLYLETFDALAEGGLPSGWTVANSTDLDSVPGPDLNNFHSDTFVDWTVISRSTLSNWFAVTPGGADYLGTLNVAPNQVINNTVVTNLISTNFIMAVSDRSDNQKQIQYLFTRDYNLSGQSNVYLAFNSIWVQNQDSLAAVEYSVNSGTTWLPAQYMLEGPDILRDGVGNIEASNTFAVVHGDVPDLVGATLGNGNYGQFIGVAANQWAGLAPYLSPRVDDNQTTSKRVEIIRLVQADNQSTIRFRLAAVGTWSWYWGIDNFGLYSVPAGAPPLFGSGPTPASQTSAVGNAASLTIAEAVGLGPITYQWRLYGTNLPGKTSTTLVFPTVLPKDAGPYDVVATNPGGSVTSTPPAVVTVINPAVFVTGEWDFNGNLAAFVGRNLENNDATVAADTSFGTTTTFGIPDINGQPTTVMHFTPNSTSWGGYRMDPQAAPNGGGTNVNQYTLIYDIYLPTATWRSLLQTDPSNASDGDVFISATGGVGISSVYSGVVSDSAWHRVAYAFDLTGPGSPVLTKFIDGVKVGNQTTGLSPMDGRFALGPYALLFGDQDGDVAETYVSSVQFSNGRRPDAFIAALGGPSSAKIPGAIKAAVESGNTVIRWTGGVPLESADEITGTWTTVLGATSPYTVPGASAKRFYRPKLP